MAYQDGSIVLTDDALTMSGHYFPGAVERSPLAAIRSVRRTDMAARRDLDHQRSRQVHLRVQLHHSDSPVAASRADKRAERHRLSPVAGVHLTTVVPVARSGVNASTTWWCRAVIVGCAVQFAFVGLFAPARAPVDHEHRPRPG